MSKETPAAIEPISARRKRADVPVTESFLSGGGQLGDLIRSFDWSKTSLGPIGAWPQSLKTTVSLMLNSQHPMWVGWGHENIFLYNDAYLHVLGLAKHPWALGRPASEVWSEIWDVCGPLADKVFQKGEATFVDDVRLFMRRAPDFLEETFYSFSYSPVRDESGAVGGLFCPSADVTAKNIGARRLGTLSELAARALREKTTGTACATAAAILAKNFEDVTFALLYLARPDGSTLVLEESTRLPATSALAPKTIALAPGQQAAPWRVGEVMAGHGPQIVSVTGTDFPFTGPADQPVKEVIVLPLISHGQERPMGVLVAGTNPTRKLDSEYQTFFTLVAGQIATIIANVQALEEERKRAEALAELDRAKTIFFSNVSHELRTPLTLMLGPLEDMLNQDLPVEGRELVSVAHRNGLRLLKLVNTLLDFSRIEAGRIQALFEPTDLGHYTTELASVFQSAAEKAGLKLVVECPGLPDAVYVDREMWEKIVLNLLSNAFKFTFEGEIRIALRWCGESVELSVEDTGVGIPEAELPKIFERFHRVRGARSRTHEGTGIGLALVQELARLHGGEVQVESREGSGTKFTVSIRTGKIHLPRERVGEERQGPGVGAGVEAFIQEAARWLPDGALDLEAAVEVPGRFPNPLADAPRVLLADDNADMRDYVGRLLGQRYRVISVADGEAAFEAIIRERPDLILTDVMMPRLSGFELLAKLRAKPETRTLPVIMLSARAGEEARVEGLDAGADDYLIKPFSARELLARVGSQLAMSKLRRLGEERVTRILESIADGFLTVNSDWRLTYLNSAASRMLAAQGLNVEELSGKHLWTEVVPEAEKTGAKAEVMRAMEEREPVAFETFYLPWRRWYVVRAYPVQEGGLSIYFQDVTDRKKAEEALRQSDERVRQANVELNERVAELQTLNGQLHVAKDQAETASRAKDRFLAQLSHELRTPLTPVLMTAAALLEDDRLPSDVRAQLGMVKHNIALEARLIDDLLDLTRVAHGKLALRIEECDVHSLLGLVVEIIREDAQEKAIGIQLELAANDCCIPADTARLQQVFWNLLRNAVKFTPRGGRIYIGSRNAGKPGERRLEVEVRDNGVGFDSESAERIFKPFEQDNRTSNGGLGLGLAIARAILELHHGSIAAASAGPGKGATFTVEMSGAMSTRAGVVAAMPAPANGDGADALESGVLKLLVVEDHESTQQVLVRLLTRKGHHVIAADSVAAAQSAAAANRFDLVISDLGLPDGTGIELMTQLRADYGLAGIALSGYGMEEDVRRSAEAGFLAHLVKPVDVAELHRAIARVRSAPVK